MFARLNSVFKKTNRNLQLPLGRWGTIKSDKVTEKKVEGIIEKNATSGNHDHCGSEICKTPTKDNNSNNVKNKIKKYVDDPYLFYII